MYNKVLTLIFFSFLATVSITAMDLNETTVIINEASQATQVLQDEFNTLLNKTSSPKENNQTISLHKISTNHEQNTTIVDNNTTNENLGTSAEGLLIYKVIIRAYCEINGEKFAKQYMQEDWEDIYQDKEFKNEVIKACPKIKSIYKDSWTPHLYQFAIEYASDSDAIPEC